MSLVVGTNSYIAAAEADALLLPHPRRETWGAHSDTERELALLLATREVDLLNFRGRLADADQALAWPRSGVVDSEGRIVDSDTVPDRVKQAQAERGPRAGLQRGSPPLDAFGPCSGEGARKTSPAGP